MVTFEIDKQEYSIQDYLSIENYVKIYKIKDFLGEEFFQAKIINALTGVKMESILRTNHTQINYLSSHIMSLFPDTEYPFIDRFTLNGIDYGFIPSWKHMSFAEFVDLDSLMNKESNEIIANLHIICAIMFRPIVSQKADHDFLIEEYDVKTMEERAELFKKELDVKYVLGGQFFFSQFVRESLNYSQQSLTQKNKNFWKKMVLTWRHRKIIWQILLNKPSDGLQLSIDYAMMTLQNTSKSSKRPFLKRLTNWFTSLRKTKK
jgi:hypothetical protein